MATRRDLFGCLGDSPWLAENQIEDIHLLFSPLTTPLLWLPKREYNAVSAIADENLQYHTGGNLTIFDDRGRPIAKVLAAKNTASLQLLYAVGARLDARTEFEVSWRDFKFGTRMQSRLIATNCI